MKILKDHVELHLVPFGKSTYQTRGSDTTFECHHGPNEVSVGNHLKLVSMSNHISVRPIQCYGNKIHACAINHIQVDSFQQENTRESLIIEYVNCLMTGVFPDQPYAQFARRCAKDVMVKTFDSIEACANSTEGSKYLEQMGEVTFKLMDPLKNVPTITVRESYDANIQASALTDFSSTVCQNLPKPHPAVCRAYSSATAVSGSIAAAVFAAIACISRMF